MTDLFQGWALPLQLYTYFLFCVRILRIVLKGKCWRKRVGLGFVYYLLRYRIERPGCSNKELLVWDSSANNLRVLFPEKNQSDLGKTWTYRYVVGWTWRGIVYIDLPFSFSLHKPNFDRSRKLITAGKRKNSIHKWIWVFLSLCLFYFVCIFLFLKRKKRT